jgi:hypothetical protein
MPRISGGDSLNFTGGGGGGCVDWKWLILCDALSPKWAIMEHIQSHVLLGFDLLSHRLSPHFASHVTPSHTPTVTRARTDTPAAHSRS